VVSWFQLLLAGVESCCLCYTTCLPGVHHRYVLYHSWSFVRGLAVSCLSHSFPHVYSVFFRRQPTPICFDNGRRYAAVDVAVSRRLISLEMFSLTTTSQWTNHPLPCWKTLQIEHNRSRLDQALTQPKFADPKSVPRSNLGRIW